VNRKAIVGKRTNVDTPRENTLAAANNRREAWQQENL
jgi:hypothetical protein